MAPKVGPDAKAKGKAKAKSKAKAKANVEDPSGAPSARAENRTQVGLMNDLAGKYGIEKVPRDASLEILRVFYRKLMLKAHPDKGVAVCPEDVYVLNEARDHFHGFVDGRSERAADNSGSTAEEHVNALAERRVRQKTTVATMGVMLTYNGTKGIMAASYEELSESFQERVVVLQEELGFVRFSATCEQSLRSGQIVTLEDVLGDTDYHAADGMPQRHHLHLFIEFPESREVDKDELRNQCTFAGMVPHCNLNKSHGNAVRRSLDRLHFYVRAEKIGSVWFFGSCSPWVEKSVMTLYNYKPEGRWIDDLWSSHKLSHAVYMKYAEMIRVGFETRKRAHDAVVSSLQTRKLNEEAARRQVVIEDGFGPSRIMQPVEDWKAKYGVLRSRYLILVLRAGSKCGKTEFAKSLFPNVWEQLIEDLAAPNFRTFDVNVHDAILLDNINDAQFILDNRGLLMARNAVHHLSQTATGLFTYPCYLHRVPVMVTMDLEKPWPTSDWLQANCVVVEVREGEYFFTPKDIVPEGPGPSSSTASSSPIIVPGQQADVWMEVHNHCQRERIKLVVDFDEVQPRQWICTMTTSIGHDWHQQWTGSLQGSRKAARRATAVVVYAGLCC